LEVFMSALDLDVLQSGVNRVYPTQAQIAAIQVVLQHPQILDALTSARDKVIATRKAHLDEIASTVSLPVDDMTNLSVQIRRIVADGYYEWAESSRTFLAQLIVALQAQVVPVPALARNYANMDRMLMAVNQLSGVTHIVSVLEAISQYQVTPWNSDPAKQAAGVSTQGPTASWASVVGSFQYSQLAPADGDDSNQVGFNGLKANPSGYIPASGNNALGATIAVLDLLLAEYKAVAVGVSPYPSTTTVSLPSLVNDIGGFYYSVYKFLRTTVQTYTGQSYKFISDADFATLTASYVSL